MASAIYKKLLEIQKAVVGLAKDAKGNAGDYVTGNKILSIVRPMMDKLGLILIPEVVDSSFEPQTYLTSKGEKKEMFCRLKLQFTWVDTQSGDAVTHQWASTGMNGFDKGYGSALTYGERYYLLKLFHIATDKDDVDAPKSAEEEMNLAQIIAQINSFTTQEQMTWAWNTYAYYHKDREFKAAFAKRQKEISDGTAR